MTTDTHTNERRTWRISGLLKKGRKALAMLSLSLAAVSSDAITFDYSYTFGSGLVISGSLDGDLNGNFVDNVSNVSVFFDGTPMPNVVSGTVHTAQWDGADWSNGPIVSFDVFQNNFAFMNTDPGFANSYFWILNDSVYLDVASAESQPLGFSVVNDPTEQARWSLTARSTSSVPDGGTTMPLLGLACVGLAWLSRRLAPSGDPILRRVTSAI